MSGVHESAFIKCNDMLIIVAHRRIIEYRCIIENAFRIAECVEKAEDMAVTGRRTDWSCLVR
jgi:hypothetical protein